MGATKFCLSEVRVGGRARQRPHSTSTASALQSLPANVSRLQSLLGQSRRLHDRWLFRLGCATVDFLRAHASSLRLAMQRHTWLLDAGLPRALAGLAVWTPLVLAELALLGLASRWAAAAVLGLLLPAAIATTFIAW